jgi:DNA invertase Pin-like site-specific DNA recombinase
MSSIAPPSFDVLVMSESSRLGREAWETGYVLKRLISAGVRVFLYLDERARASQRSIDKALQLARAGHVTGGRVFGYDNVRVDSHTERRINKTEAAIVRRIFQLAADGIGQKRIARRLNDEGVATPRAQQGRPAAWVPSSVHQVLRRELYRGGILWKPGRRSDRCCPRAPGAAPARSSGWRRCGAGEP